MGTLTEVDSAGRFLVNWDNGKRTALNLEDDHYFRIFQSDPMELKLYFPLHGELYTRNEWGDLADDPEELAGSELAPYLGDIREALQENQLPEEQERGLMHWYRESDALTWKVKSAFFDVELHDGQLWGVADCQLLESPRGGRTWPPHHLPGGTSCRRLGRGLRAAGDSPWAGGLLYVHLWDGQDWEMTTTEPGAGGVATDGDVPMTRKENPLEELEKSLRPMESLYKAGRQRPFLSGRCQPQPGAEPHPLLQTANRGNPDPCTRIVKCPSGSCLPR